MIPLLLSSIAGLSTMIGSILIFTNIKSENLIKYSLSFSAGVMICISIFILIPESIQYMIKTNTYKITFINVFIYTLMGTIISFLIDKILPNYNKLYKTGIFVLIALMIHNIPEGIITFITSSKNITLGITITFAIMLHNIPEGISISVPIYKSTNSKKKAILYTFFAGISEIIGSLFALFFLKNTATYYLLGVINLVTAGIMLYISLFELLIISLSYKNKIKTLLFLILGIIFMGLSNFFISS